MGKKIGKISDPGAESSDAPVPITTDPFFELTLDLLCIAGTDGYFKRVNPSFERVLGYSAEELTSRPFVSFVHPDDVASTIREIQTLDTGKPTVMFENRYMDRFGNARWIQWNAAAPNRDGVIYAVARDITAKKSAEEKLLHYSSELELANKQLKSTQEQLIQAEKMESVGRLAAGVAHEVRNPLALILMGVDYLSSGIEPGDPRVPEILEEMKSAINRADRIVRGLVNFSSESRLQLAPVDFRALAGEVVLMMRHQLTRRGVRVDLEIPKDLPPVQADRGRLEQIFVNLMSNAIQAMENTPEPRLWIRARRELLDDVSRDQGARTMDHLRDGDSVIVIEVVDNGPGIASSDLPKLFEPFFTTKPTGVGTGLGLTVVRRLVDLHRGRIEIHNDPVTGGANVSLTLKPTHAKA